MNGRSYPAAATAVDRASGPVLAWNVEATQFPAGGYPEMPAAAAAAVSPVVPAASAAAAPPDPYGRCWQNQVDPSACFPYFGTLYGTSLPPPSYRMQPGCLSNLGQFWPPTPPPEGCVRYDGTNNLHYCSPLTPVFRHSESLPQNMLGVQRLGHYTHLIDMNKDPALKRLDACLDGMQRQKFLQGSKHSKESQQRTCSCYECNEQRNSSHNVTQSVNKENIGGSSKLLEQKYSEDKLNKTKSCRRVKDDGYPHSRGSLTYHPSASAITSYNCSMEPTRTSSTLHGANQSGEYVSQQKLENPNSSSSCVQHDFVRPENSNAYHGSRCTPASSFVSSMTPSKDVSQMVYSTAKSSEQSRIENSNEKTLRHKLQVSTPGYDQCYPAVQTPSSSTYRSSDNSCCFSPPFVSSRTLYHNYPENSTHSKTPNMLMMYGNGYNASPLKNVYFSYYESENVDTGSTTPSNRKNKSNYGKVEKYPNLSDVNGHLATPVSQNSFCVSSASSLLNGKTPRGTYDSTTVPSDSYGCIYQTPCIEQQRSTTSNTLDPVKRVYPDQVPKLNFVHIKQEKVENTDCKFQKSRASNAESRISDLPETVLNLSTSIRCPKVEPIDHGNISSNKPAITSPVNAASSPVDACTQNMENGYFSGSTMKCHEVPDAMTPQMHDCTPAVPEDLGPMVQTAPCGGAELANMSKVPTTGHEAPFQVGCPSQDSIERPRSMSRCSPPPPPLALQCLSNVPCSPKECHLSPEKETTSWTSTDLLLGNSVAVLPIGSNHDTQASTEEPILSILKEELVETTSEVLQEVAHHEEELSHCVDELSVEVKKEVILDASCNESSHLPAEDCHGLYVLLQGIAQKTSTDSTDKDPDTINSNSQSPPLESKMKGLNLLCALAEEQFRTEFGDPSVKKEAMDCENAPSKLSSNYPAVKEEILSEPLSDEMNVNNQSSGLDAELTMRKKLAELQQIYKEKQKELARLKAKKGSSETALQNSSPSSNCSKESSFIWEENRKSYLGDSESSDKKSCSENTSQKSTKLVKSCSEGIADQSASKAMTMMNDHADAKSVPKTINRTQLSKCSSLLKRKRLDLKQNPSGKTSKSTLSRKSQKKMPSLSESDANEESRRNCKRQKKYSKHKSRLNHFRRSPSRMDEEMSRDFEQLNVQLCMKSPKKRKAENPKRFMPSKQVRLTETIVTKQLRNRILFEEPNSFSEKSQDKPYDVPEALFDALRKCHLSESKTDDIEEEAVTSPIMPKLTAEPILVQLPRAGIERQLRMTDDNMLENQRILAIEEGLFYAGCIREVQSNNTYAIVLDGQRGSKKHLFSKEEMLTQTILESKPESLADLPEGTRVCAYWSHQYRCLYPGTVMKAPTPSVDWSEPRVFVEFDDGDSAQIAMKNIRFLPPDMQIPDDEEDSGCGNTSLDSKDGSSMDSNDLEQQDDKKLEESPEITLNFESTDFSKNGANNHCSNIEVDDDPSQTTAERSPERSIDSKASNRRQASKQKSGNKTKSKDGSTSPSKKHKKYKERHKHHHHHRHHHRHHRHCHHHRHCKKRKHHKRTSNPDSNIINVIIPSSSIPLSHLTTRSSLKDSKKKHLPQACEGDSKSSTRGSKANR